MVQVLVWNGEDRPPIVKVAGAFSNGNPTVGDTLTVRRGGSNVGAVEVLRTQYARRRALVELLTGDLPEAGDVLRWNGNSDADVESVSNAAARRGDVVDLLDDGRHPGTRIVTGPNWDDPVDYSTALGRALTPAERSAGQWPDFVIVDIPGPTAHQARVSLANRMASIVGGLGGTPRKLPDLLAKSLRIDYQALPVAARNNLRDDGRATATAAQLIPFLTLKRGVTTLEIRDRITANGRDPSALTDYL